MNETNKKIKPIISVCGKGGVGKTVFSAMLSRALLMEGFSPLLLVDADPVGGLTGAIGEVVKGTLASVKENFIRETRERGKEGAAEAAENLNYFILEALSERKDYSLLAMGHTTKKGCFCSANSLLRSALNEIIHAYAAALIDAEAGIEQINREVTRDVNKVFVVIDASQRSIETLQTIAEMVDPSLVTVVVNRFRKGDPLVIPAEFNLGGTIPEDEALRQFDREGISLWKLPVENAAFRAVRGIAREAFSIAGR